MLVDKSKIRFDKKQCFSLLKDFVDVAFSTEDNSVVSMDDLFSFYRECIAEGLSDFTTLSLEGFVCIQSFFVLINSRAGKIRTMHDVKSGSSEKKGILKNTKNSGVTSISSTHGKQSQGLDFGKTV